MNTDYFGDIPTLRDLSAQIVDMDEGRALAAALGQAPALFLANHGVVFCGASIEEVTCVGMYLERAAWTHLGGWLAPPTLAAALRARRHAQIMTPRHWEHPYGDLAWRLARTKAA